MLRAIVDCDKPVVCGLNGVAALHTELLKETVLADFYALWPEKFTSVTNGVTQRRFMLHANPKLSELISLCERWADALRDRIVDRWFAATRATYAARGKREDGGRQPDQHIFEREGGDQRAPRRAERAHEQYARLLDSGDELASAALREEDRMLWVPTVHQNRCDVLKVLC